MKWCQQCGATIPKRKPSRWLRAMFCSAGCRRKSGSRPRVVPSKRFFAFVRIGRGCWMWTGHADAQGYGTFWMHNRSVRAHRAAYELAYGQITQGRLVCHKCDNPMCVRPDHLLLGSAADNTHDAVTKGRMARGSRVNTSKIDEDAVRAVRLSLSRGESGVAVAQRFGVSSSAISQIKNGRTWAWLV